MIEKTGKALIGLDTDSHPRPGDFELGSAQSRAAARAQLIRSNDLSTAGPRNMTEASSTCWKCFLSGLPCSEPAGPETNDPHYDYERGEYRYLGYSLDAHARIGAHMVAP